MSREQREQDKHSEQNEHGEHVPRVNSTHTAVRPGLPVHAVHRKREESEERENTVKEIKDMQGDSLQAGKAQIAKQSVFSFSREQHTRSAIAKLPQYDAGNLRAARIILADRQRYEIECRFLVLWAELVIQRLGTVEERRAAA